MEEIIRCCQAVREKHPECRGETCYEAIANGKNPELTEVHGFVVDDKYFVASKTMKVYDIKQWQLIVENIGDALYD